MTPEELKSLESRFQVAKGKSTTRSASPMGAIGDGTLLTFVLGLISAFESHPELIQFITMLVNLFKKPA